MGSRLPAEALVDREKGIKSRFHLVSNDKANPWERISYLDMIIADAVYTLYMTDQTSFSEGMILRALSGDDRQTCRKETADRIRASLEKMANISFSLDCEDEMRAHKIEFDNIEEERFLSLKQLKNGKYEMTAPPLYRYAEKCGQFISVPARLWSLDYEKPAEESQRKPRSDSLELIAIKHYLLHRIAVANYDRRKKQRLDRRKMLDNLNKIYYYRRTHRKLEYGEPPFTGMLFDLGVVDAWETKNDIELRDFEGGDAEAIRCELSRLKKRTHKNTEKILDALIKIGYIEGYAPIKGAGKEIVGVEIKGTVKKLDDFRE